jgi:hypothetical protein
VLAQGDSVLAGATCCQCMLASCRRVRSACSSGTKSTRLLVRFAACQGSVHHKGEVLMRYNGLHAQQLVPANCQLVLRRAPPAGCCVLSCRH